MKALSCFIERTSLEDAAVEPVPVLAQLALEFDKKATTGTGVAITA